MLAFVFLLLGSLFARADDWQQSFLLTEENRHLANSLLNPNNLVWPLANNVIQAESRSNIHVEKSIFLLTLRPRAETALETVNGANREQGSLFFQELFLQMKLTENFSLSAGRIQFGWGPADSITPSNWMAPDLQYESSPNFEQFGISRVQASWSASDIFHVMGAAETGPLPDNTNSRTLTKEQNQERLLAKLEWSWDNTNKIIGLTSGRVHEAYGYRAREGFYSAITLNDAWLLYADTLYKQTGAERNWDILAVPGLRYTFPGGAEIRVEEIYNQAGLTSAQESTAIKALVATNSLTQSLLQSQSASLSGKNYSYAAFRWTNPAFLSMLHSPSFALRALHSLADGSQAILSDFDFGIGDQYTLSVYGSITSGGDNSELRGLFDRLLGISLKMSI